MGKNTTSIAKAICYIALMLAALLFLLLAIENIFSMNWGVFGTVIRLVKDICVLLGIAFGAFDFAQNKKKTVWMVLFWVALIVYIAGAFFGIFNF